MNGTLLVYSWIHPKGFFNVALQTKRSLFDIHKLHKPIFVHSSVILSVLYFLMAQKNQTWPYHSKTPQGMEGTEGGMFRSLALVSLCYKDGSSWEHPINGLLINR